MSTASDKFIPVHSLPALKGAPSIEQLALIAKAAEQQEDTYVIQSWPGSQNSNHQLLSLRALVQLKGRSSRNGTVRVEPQWALLVGNPRSAEIAWVHTTGDLGLVMSLIMSHLGGEICAIPQPTPLTSSNNPAVRPQRLSSPGVSQTFCPTTGEWSLNEAPSQDLPVPTTTMPGLQHSELILAGDLRKVELQNVLQSLNLCRMSGALVLTSQIEKTTVYLHDGEVVDANLESGFSSDTVVASNISGSDALLEVLTWEDGTFSFDAQVKASKVTIKRKVQGLLMEAMMLRDYCESLKLKGVDLETRFQQKNPSLSRTEIDEIFKQGLPLNPELQHQIYNQMKDGISLYEILKTRPMSKASYVPVIFNLLNLDLSTVKDGQQSFDSQANHCFEIKETLVTKFIEDATRPNTGILSEGAFSWLVEREVKRWKKGGRPFTVLLFETRCERGLTVEPLSNEETREMGSRLKTVLGPLDAVGHFNVDFAMLLPDSVLPAGTDLFDKLASFLSRPFVSGASEISIQLVITLYTPASDGRLILRECQPYKNGKRNGVGSGAKVGQAF